MRTLYKDIYPRLLYCCVFLRGYFSVSQAEAAIFADAILRQGKSKRERISLCRRARRHISAARGESGGRMLLFERRLSINQRGNAADFRQARLIQLIIGAVHRAGNGQQLLKLLQQNSGVRFQHLVGIG